MNVKSNPNEKRVYRNSMLTDTIATMLFPLCMAGHHKAVGSGAETFMHGCHTQLVYAAVEDLSIVAADGEGGRSSYRGDETNVRGRWSDFYALTQLHAYCLLYLSRKVAI